MSKGGGGDTTSTVYQNTLPKYAEPYFQNIMEGVQKEMNRQYQPYGGTRIAPQTPQTVAGLNMLQKYAQSPMTDLKNARSLTELVGKQAIDLQNYEAGKVTNSYTGPQDWRTGEFNADQVAEERVGVQNFDAGVRDQYMSPYMDAVTEAAQRDAQKKALEEQAYLKAEAGKTGAFGGSRAAVQQQMAANAAQERISDIGVQGRQAAFENAQQQFERDRAAGLTAAQSNQRAALEADLANQAKNLEALGMGEQSRQFGYQLGEAGRQKAAELGMMSQYQTEELRRAGKELGLQGLQVAGGAAGQLAQFQSQLDDLTLQRARAQMGVGQYQQDYTQQILDQRYQDFLNQRDYNRNTLTWAGGVLHGVPTGTNQTQTTTTPSNPLMGGLGGMMAWNAYNNLWGQGNQAGAGNG